MAKLTQLICSIERAGAGEVAIRFNTASNWTYSVQELAGLPASPARGWSNVFTAPAKPCDSQAVFLDAATNAQPLYRLVLSP